MKLTNLLALILLLLAFQGKAQKNNDRNVLHPFFGAKDKDFDINEAPEEWKSEPVVLLCQKINVRFTRRKSGARTIKGALRKRILIQDKAALEEFSEFYYSNTENLGLQIIKPNGTVKDINFEDAVKVETDVPRFYRDSYSSSEYYKVALPNLEVGDILDFFKTFQDDGVQTELINPIANVYPTVYQEIIFDVKGWSFFYNTFNGAPAFSKKAVKNKKGKDSGMTRFIITDNKREAMKEERWSFSYLSEPIFKIMAVPTNAKIGTKRLKETIDTKFNVKNVFKAKVDEGENLYKESSLKTYIKTTLKGLKVKKMPVKERVEVIYNAIRYNFMHLATSPIPAQGGFSRYDNYVAMRSDVFIATFINTLKKHDVEAYPVVVTPRFFGGIDEVINEREIEFGVYVPATKKYYWTVDSHRCVGDNYTRASGAEGYRFSKEKGFKKINLPPSSAEDNIIANDIEITIKEDNSLSFIGSRSYSGTYKRYYNTALLLQTNFISEDRYYFSTDREKEKIDREKTKAKTSAKSRTSKRVRKWREISRKRAEELSDRKQKFLTDWLKEDYELEELQSFTVTSFGRFPEANSLEAAFEFTSNGYLKKAGPNLVFEVGKLITGQVELDEEEINERQAPIDMEYARTISNTFSITLPEGYQASGLNGLNMNVDNPYAAFISTASQEGNILTIETSKIYKKDHFAKEHWPEMVKMLEAAYDFSQKKIILKK